MAGGEQGGHEVDVHALGADEFERDLAGAGRVDDEMDADRGGAPPGGGVEYGHEAAQVADDVEILDAERHAVDMAGFENPARGLDEPKDVEGAAVFETDARTTMAE